MPNNFAFATIFEFYIWKISTPLCRNQRRVSSQCLLVSVLCYCTASSHLFSEILCGNEIICQEPSKSGAQVVGVIHEWKKYKENLVTLLLEVSMFLNYFCNYLDDWLLHKLIFGSGTATLRHEKDKHFLIDLKLQNVSLWKEEKLKVKNWINIVYLIYNATYFLHRNSCRKNVDF